MRAPAWLAVASGLAFASVPVRAEPPAFVVFFQEWSAAIDPQAQQVIANAAAFAKAHPGATARVIGFADPTGSQKANVLLSELRAQVVTDGLTAAGLPGLKISEVGRGSVQFASTPQESRRVEIRVGG